MPLFWSDLEKDILEDAVFPADGEEMMEGPQFEPMRPRSAHRRQHCPLAMD